MLATSLLAQAPPRGTQAKCAVGRNSLHIKGTKRTGAGGDPVGVLMERNMPNRSLRETAPDQITQLVDGTEDPIAHGKRWSPRVVTLACSERHCHYQAFLSPVLHWDAVQVEGEVPSHVMTMLMGHGSYEDGGMLFC